MFSETKSVLDFCLEIGSVTAEGKPTYDIRTNNDANHRNYGKQHILFKDADASTAMIAKKLTAEDLRDASKIQVSWFESPDSEVQGFMVHGIGVSASYAVESVVIG
jgi:nucleoside 2-deoxyribosyltransferase